MSVKSKETKAEWLAREVAKAVGAGKPCDGETVDFSNPDRPPTCLEIDFPILPINQIAAIEGNAGKPIYQMSKWWARRRSSVFRSMLIAGAMKAPEDPAEAAKLVWNSYYANHQKKGAFNQIKVADIFMGGGTTVVEGSRLGMQMYGNDLNPVAWFVVKNEMTKVDKVEVEGLLNKIEAEVKPQIAPFYTCPCPRGHVGTWKEISTGKVIGDGINPISLSPSDRKKYTYEGPEIIYVFWAKHGPCQVTGCGHRTPIMTSPVMALKTLSVKYWNHVCKNCGLKYDLEEREARMAPGVPLVVADSEKPHCALEGLGATCPQCDTKQEVASVINQKAKKKKIELSLLVHPEWLKGESKTDDHGNEYGGSVDSSAEATIRWNQARARQCRLVEVRGTLPEEITCPETKVTFRTSHDGGTVPKRSNYACGACGTVQDVLKTVKKSGTTGPVAMYGIQGYCRRCDKEGHLYGGRFFVPVTDSSAFDAALTEWEIRKETDLKNYWPRSELSYGWKTHGWAIPDHGFTHYWKMFNPRQLLTLGLLLKVLKEQADNKNLFEFVLGAFQQYLRNQNMYCFWDIGYDKLVPHMSNNNFHPKNNLVENCVFPNLGRGNWRSCTETLFQSLEWAENPWELVRNELLKNQQTSLADSLRGKSEKTFPGDSLTNHQVLESCSSTELDSLQNASYDLVITDPPFGGIMQYAELADFFYVWLRLVLANQYPDYFGAQYTPKSLEAVSNPFRQPEEPDVFYQRLLTSCWREAHRILKQAGILAFTFHHSEDAPWVSVLESLFDAGFYLEATYPIRSDETKGSGEFGSQKIEYDIIHVCRKRMEEPKAISWAKMRRQVLQDVRSLQDLLEHHSKDGLPEADLQVIRRGKALEYFSRHYGKVFKDQDAPMSVQEALVGINQLLDEEASGVKEAPPNNAEPFTRMFLRLFDGINELPRDQMQKYLRGTGTGPSDFIDRGWCIEKDKIFYLRSPVEIAQEWQGKYRRGMTSDYDQAAFLVGACHEDSGINASDTLNNPNFKPHPALPDLLTWLKTHGASKEIRHASITALQLYRIWESKHQTPQHKQLNIFFKEEDA